MKRSKKSAKIETVSNYWKPEEKGETHEGVLKGVTQSEIDGRPTFSMRIGDKSVSVTTVILGFISPLLKTLKLGKDKLKFEFIGYGKQKGKRNPPRLFRVWLNGKELESVGGFGTPVSLQDMGNVLAGEAAKRLKK